ncbi:MAG TPA: DNA-binding protein [Bacteroidales bacterium]|nr:DNA-binding protein [Bacteroidales bacterium]HOK76040.1 DNA-binding protein [Bacteroidales bacterium]
MSRTLTFNELRSIKDRLPAGSIKKIADKLNLSEETVRNYFGGWNFEKGESAGLHYEKGPNGGIVVIEDTTILDIAEKMIKSTR